MDFEVLTEYFVVVVMVACLCLGYVIKKWIADVENKYIPTILFFFGAIFNAAVSGVTINNIVFGSLMGLASTGLHQAFTRFIEKRGEQA
jgi:hypothetical protein